MCDSPILRVSISSVCGLHPFVTIGDALSGENVTSNRIHLPHRLGERFTAGQLFVDHAFELLEFCVCSISDIHSGNTVPSVGLISVMFVTGTPHGPQTTLIASSGIGIGR